MKLYRVLPQGVIFWYYSSPAKKKGGVVFKDQANVRVSKTVSKQQNEAVTETEAHGKHCS